MVFSSLEFLFLFFPIILFIYLFIKPCFGNFWLLCASIVFYFLGAKQMVWLLIAIIMIAYIGGLIENQIHDILCRKLVLIVTIGAMILCLSYFKYSNFLIYNINIFLDEDIMFKDIVLPIGISFFVFQAISYVVDVYRGEQALINPIDMGLYISFFPQLIAGPIVRFKDVREYLDIKYRAVKLDSISEGIWRFSIGFCKKVLLANNLGGLANLVFGVKDISEYSVLYTWLGAIAFTLQIYYDFSGYSDMAIGLGKMFGFEFQENFNYPYAASSIRDFWKRWHISLSQFFRDYVYIPLGGNRCSTFRNIFNLLCVWFLTGMWHGASWNYIIWGFSYGILLILERSLVDRIRINKGIAVARRIITLIIVILLWVIFKCEHMSDAVRYLGNMFGIGAASFCDHAFIFQAKNFGGLIIFSTILAFPLKYLLKDSIRNNFVYRITITALLFLGIISSVSFIYMGSYNPFLYFMF